MVMDPANAEELANIAREIGAEVIEGTALYPSDTGCWLIGDLDFCEHLDTYRGRKVGVVIADCGEADEQPEEYTLRDLWLCDEQGKGMSAVQDSERARWACAGGSGEGTAQAAVLG